VTDMGGRGTRRPQRCVRVGKGPTGETGYSPVLRRVSSQPGAAGHPGAEIVKGLTPAGSERLELAVPPSCYYAMPMQRSYTAAEAARALGISLDTLRRWDRAGRIRTERDSANRRLVPASEIARLRGGDGEQMSARNHFRGIVRDVKIEGLLAQVELDVTEPARVVAIITRDAAEELGLRPGIGASAVVKATSVMVELR
jgi:molybdopterin-binding protein